MDCGKNLVSSCGEKLCKKPCEKKQCCDKIAFLIKEDDFIDSSFYYYLATYYNFIYQVQFYDSSNLLVTLEHLLNEGYKCFIGINDDNLAIAIPWFITHQNTQLVTLNTTIPNLPKNIFRFSLDNIEEAKLLASGIARKTASYDALIFYEAGATYADKSNALAAALIAKGGSVSGPFAVDLSSVLTASLDIVTQLPSIVANTTIFFMTSAENLPTILDAFNQVVIQNGVNISGKTFFDYARGVNGQNVKFEQWNISITYPVNPLLETFEITSGNIEDNVDKALTVEAARWLRSCDSAFEGLTGYIRFRGQNRIPTLGIFYRRQNVNLWTKNNVFPVYY